MPHISHSPSPFRNHFIEYLCVLVRENGVDPVTILSTIDLETVLRRANRRLPVRPYFFRHDTTLSDSIFHRELLKVHKHDLIHLCHLLLFSLLSFFNSAITNKNARSSNQTFILHTNAKSHKHAHAPTTNRLHFVEYLVSIVAKAKIDSLPILDLSDCVQELRRRGIPLPERGPW